MKIDRIFFTACCVLCVACAKSGNAYVITANPNATPEARALLSTIYETVEQGRIISAQHHYFQPDRYEQDRDRILELTGKVPLMWGGEMGWVRQTVVDRAIEEYEKGHIITLMWHSQRPLDEGETDFANQCQGEFSAAEWDQLVTPGTETHKGWLAKVDEVAGYLKILKDRGIPVLWRPYHEMNGGWFWWGDRRGENGYVKLWKMMYDRYVNHHKLDNLIWVWNANGLLENAHDYALYYPGNEYVDVLATDIYNNNWKQINHDKLLELGGGKPIALGEIGQLPTPEILRQQNKFAWFMIWAGFTSPEYNSPDAIKALYDIPNIIVR
jgi:mannan endo-1,4-beta-mannosidase